MDAHLLPFSLDLVAGSGNTLTVEQKAALQTSLVIVKKNYKFSRVLFWGKILGVTADYFIAQGRGEDEIRNKTFLYSFNCMDWFLLPPVTDAMIADVSKVERGRFIGDPLFICNLKMGDLDIPERPDEESKVNEEIRLTVTVNQIDEEVSVVPRGAFVKQPHGAVQINRCFNGLSYTAAKKLDSFMHFTPPKIDIKTPGAMGEWTPAIDFLDLISDDIPKGCWSLQFECAGQVCVLRSLMWIGLTFYHLPGTPHHGYIYMGEGLKNMNILYMV